MAIWWGTVHMYNTFILFRLGNMPTHLCNIHWCRTTFIAEYH